MEGAIHLVLQLLVAPCARQAPPGIPLGLAPPLQLGNDRPRARAVLLLAHVPPLVGRAIRHESSFLICSVLVHAATLPSVHLVKQQAGRQAVRQWGQGSPDHICDGAPG